MILKPDGNTFTDEENEKFSFFYSRIGSVGRALDCREGGRRFDSLGGPILRVLNITEKRRYFLCPANG